MLGRLIGGFELSIEGADDLGAVKIDRGQLELLLLNLAVNARDEGPRSGKLVVRMCNVARAVEGISTSGGRLPAGAYVAIELMGSRCEAPPGRRGRSLEASVRDECAGIGLPEVRRIAHELGGGICVEAASDSSARVMLPRVSDDEPPHP